jgi:sarcosine oxidase subunit delta
MSYQLSCPNCGLREVTDFGFGGETHARPTASPGERELGRYIYFRRNVAGPQVEWWHHRSGCRAWFLAERDTRTNAVAWTALPADAPLQETPGA